MKSDYEIKEAMEKYSDIVKRICFIHLKNYHDTEDIFQTVFLKYALNKKVFENGEHEKAWIIRVTINCCKDLLKSFFRSKVELIDNYIESYGINFMDNDKEIIYEVLKLPEKYRNVLYLFYYEGYSAIEIAHLLNKNVNTIYTWLSRGKSLLKDNLEEVYHNG